MLIFILGVYFVHNGGCNKVKYALPENIDTNAAYVCFYNIVFHGSNIFTKKIIYFPRNLQRSEVQYTRSRNFVLCI